jgi:hypothetical protein
MPGNNKNIKLNIFKSITEHEKNPLIWSLKWQTYNNLYKQFLDEPFLSVKINTMKGKMG